MVLLCLRQWRTWVCLKYKCGPKKGIFMTDPKVTGLRDIIKDNANSGGQNMQNAINGNKMI